MPNLGKHCSVFYLATLCLWLTASTCSLSNRGCTFAASLSTFSTASCELRKVFCKSYFGVRKGNSDYCLQKVR